MQLSHDGRHLSWSAPVNGVLNVHVAPIDNLAAARPVTSATRRPIYAHFWAYDNRTIVYADDVGGDENIRIFAVDIATLAKRDLTPLAGVKAQPIGYSRRHRTRIAIGLNDRDPQWHDLWDIDIATGERRLVRENRDQIAGYVLDQDLIPRLVTRSQPDGSEMLYKVKGEKLDTLEPVLTIPFADSLTTGARHFTADGKAWYLASSVGRDRTALFKVDFATGAQTLVAEHPKADIDGLLTDARTLEVTAVSATHVRQEWIAIDRTVGADLAWLKDELKTDFGIFSQTEDDTRWVVVGGSAEQPAVYYLFDRPQRRLTRLFSARPQLERYTLAPMHGHIVRSRDGLDLVCYLTLPANERGARPARPLPMVLNVHGGPWASRQLRLRPRAPVARQPRLCRAVGQLPRLHRLRQGVRQRRRHGMGRAHARRPHRRRQLGGRRGHRRARTGSPSTAPPTAATPRSSARPSRRRCSAAPSASSASATWRPSSRRSRPTGSRSTRTWCGASATRAPRPGAPMLRARSPLNRASAISRPLLILQGANDPRVKQAESDQIVAAAKARGLPVTYALYPDEGHGFIIPANRISSYAIIEAFLAQHLGGAGDGAGAAARFEPIGADLRGSSLTVDGAQHVPGLEAALKART